MVPVVLGVAGGTGAGKTTVVQAILEAVGSERIVSLEQDAYYRDVEWGSPEEIRNHNFDRPEALDGDLLLSHLEALKRGESVEAPVYDFVAHRRRPERRRVEPRPVVLLEGILLLAEQRLRELLDLKIYVDTDPDVRLIRRLRRDLDERGRTLDEVLNQYVATVRPMHLELVEPSKRWADVIIPADGANPEALKMVVARVEQLLAGSA